MTMLSAQNVCKSVKTGQDMIQVLQGCSLELQGGGLTAIVGHSGSGKSSLLMCLSGLDQPTSGHVVVDQHDIYSLSASQRAQLLRTEIGFVFQQYNLVPFLTVEENIILPFQLDHAHVPHETVAELIEAFGLSHRRNTPARSLSGGEQQRTALCRALARRPGIVFADEPTGALDSENTELVLSTLRRMADEGQMVVMVTHDLDAAALADTVIIMRDGRTVTTLGQSTSLDLLTTMNAYGA